MKKIIAAFIFCGLLQSTTTAEISNPADSTMVKKGWTFGALPAIAYDSDIGFKYGALANFYYFGDGSTYPHYLHSLYFEWSRTTKGSGIDQFIYDSEHLIPGVRMLCEFSRLTEQTLDFYGFNGYNSTYNAQFEDDKSADYISRVFYRMDREIYRAKADFQGSLIKKKETDRNRKLNWLAGFEINAVRIGTVDIDKLNKGKDPDKRLPDTALLYDKFVEWGLISGKESDGGTNTVIKMGLVYDTRNQEALPTKGIWSDVQFLWSPAFLGNDEMNYLKLAITHRQYFTAIPNKLSFAYRLSIQSKIAGDIPFYMLPMFYNTAPGYTRDGLGGARTLRGILRNRVTGDGFALANAEVRWKFLNTRIGKQNFYAALSGFTDVGMVTNPYHIPDIESLDLTAAQKAEAGQYISAGKESPHLSLGFGLHLALNENFVLAIDYGFATDKRDGSNGLYIVLGWLF